MRSLSSTVLTCPNPFFTTACSHRLVQIPIVSSDRAPPVPTLQCRFCRMSTRLHRQDLLMVSASTSLLMMRTRSSVRCRGIYRLRDTSRVGTGEREREMGGGRGACKKKPRFIAGKFPSWRYFQKWWRMRSKKKAKRRSFSPGELFAAGSAVVSYPQGSDTEKGADTPFASPVSPFSVAASLF